MTRFMVLVGCIALSVLVSSCIIPQKKEYVMRPNEVFKVIYPDWSLPTGCYLNFTLTKKQGGIDELVSNEQFFADSRQIIVMEEKRESEIVYPLMMHGVPFYYYNEQI